MLEFPEEQQIQAKKYSMYAYGYFLEQQTLKVGLKLPARFLQSPTATAYM